jgi:hypothetical protein
MAFIFAFDIISFALFFSTSATGLYLHTLQVKLSLSWTQQWLTVAQISFVIHQISFVIHWVCPQHEQNQGCYQVVQLSVITSKHNR